MDDADFRKAKQESLGVPPRRLKPGVKNCPTCKGEGKMVGGMGIPVVVTCETCDGRGKVRNIS